MNDQDRDLILDLAAGQLSEAEAAEASARIASDPELAQAYAAQELAIASLSSLPAVEMSTTEREELRTGLITGLNLESSPSPVAVAAASPKRAARWWLPVAGLAAAAAVVTAVVILPANLGGDDSDSAALQATPDTAAVQEERFADGGGDGNGTAGSAEATTTTQASAEATTTTPASASDEGADATAEEGPEEGAPQPQVRSTDVLSATEGDDSPEEAEEGVKSAGYSLAPLDIARTAEVDSCLEQVGTELPQGDIIPIGTHDVDGTEVLFVGITDDLGIAAVAAIDLDLCQIVEIARR